MAAMRAEMLAKRAESHLKRVEMVAKRAETAGKRVEVAAPYARDDRDGSIRGDFTAIAYPSSGYFRNPESCREIRMRKRGTLTKYLRQRRRGWEQSR